MIKTVKANYVLQPKYLENIAVNRELEVHFIDGRVTFQSDGKRHEVSFSDQLNEKLSSQRHCYGIEMKTHMVQTLTDEALKRLCFEKLRNQMQRLYFLLKANWTRTNSLRY